MGGVREVGVQAGKILELDNRDERGRLGRARFVARSMNRTPPETDAAHRGDGGHRSPERVGESPSFGGRKIRAWFQQDEMPEHGQRYQPRTK